MSKGSDSEPEAELYDEEEFKLFLGTKKKNLEDELKKKKEKEKDKEKEKEKERV